MVVNEKVFTDKDNTTVEKILNEHVPIGKNVECFYRKNNNTDITFNKGKRIDNSKYEDKAKSYYKGVMAFMIGGVIVLFLWILLEFCFYVKKRFLQKIDFI